MRKLLVAGLVLFGSIGTAKAGTITAQGAVVALTNVTQMVSPIGTANFAEGPSTGNVPLGTYTPIGMTFHTGPLSQILPGVTNTGSASQAQYASDANFGN